MTEEQWLSCTDPMPMLEFLGDSSRLTERKLRLLAVACCRRVWHLLTNERSQKAVEVAELYADGRVFLSGLFLAYSEASAVRHRSTRQTAEVIRHALELASEAVIHAAASEAGSPDFGEGEGAGYDACDNAVGAAHCVARAVAYAGRAGEDFVATLNIESNIVRDIFGNPFRAKPAIDRTWLAWGDGIVARLAEEAYQERDLPAGTLDVTRLGVLADALLDAGCDDAEFLAHLRSPGPHARGCFALDALLEKE
jgi:hypothetical protein